MYGDSSQQPVPPPLPLTLLEGRQDDDESGTDVKVPDLQDDPLPGVPMEAQLSPAVAEEEVVARVEYRDQGTQTVPFMADMFRNLAQGLDNVARAVREIQESMFNLF